MSSGNEPLPPTPQDFYDEQRNLYGADTQALDLDKLKKCNHYLERSSASEVKCKYCNAGWVDLGQFRLVDGRPL